MFILTRMCNHEMLNQDIFINEESARFEFRRMYEWFDADAKIVSKSKKHIVVEYKGDVFSLNLEKRTISI